MPHDLRVKALVRPPRQHESSGGSDASEYAASAVSSDEEWMDSSAEVSSTTSSGTSQSKQDRSEGFDHPRNVQGDEQDGKQLEVAAPRLQHSEFESWEDLDMYLAEYMKDTYQCCLQATREREEEKAAVESYGVWSSDQCAHVLDLTAKACLTYETMHLVLTKSNLAGLSKEESSHLRLQFIYLLDLCSLRRTDADNAVTRGRKTEPTRTDVRVGSWSSSG
ncbi:hypothetical protein PC123_g12580 [Phytophthora cactorum]|nr:hypothetical protein PC123_g12580 [Phytophthora cactorum]